MSEFDALLRFARSRYDGGPMKLHRGVRSIKAGTYGWTAEAVAWIFGNGVETQKQTTTAPCSHSYSAELGGCAWCGVHGADGRIITHKGVRTTQEVVYRFPYKAALTKLARLPVPVGFPSLDRCVALAVRHGAQAPQLVVGEWAAVGDEKAAKRHLALALRRFRSVYSEAPPQTLPR